MKTIIIPIVLILISLLKFDSFAGNLNDNNDGTITDINTALMWQQSVNYQMIWEEAIGYCESLSLGGYDDWRLPNIRELVSIIDETNFDPAIDRIAFPGITWPMFRSSTTVPDMPSSAWIVDFFKGSVRYYDKYSGDRLGVRCVRTVP